MDPLEFEFKVSRSVTVTRGEECRAKIRVVPKSAFQKLTPEKQIQVAGELREALQEDPSLLSLHSDGEPYICEPYFFQYFAAEIHEGPWEYDGGEVTTRHEVYNRRMERDS
jgi:hypothetical protein